MTKMASTPFMVVLRWCLIFLLGHALIRNGGGWGSGGGVEGRDLPKVGNLIKNEYGDPSKPLRVVSTQDFFPHFDEESVKVGDTGILQPLGGKNRGGGHNHRTTPAPRPEIGDTKHFQRRHRVDQQFVNDLRNPTLTTEQKQERVQTYLANKKFTDKDFENSITLFVGDKGSNFKRVGTTNLWATDDAHDTILLRVQRDQGGVSTGNFDVDDLGKTHIVARSEAGGYFDRSQNVLTHLEGAMASKPTGSTETVVKTEMDSSFSTLKADGKTKGRLFDFDKGRDYKKENYEEAEKKRKKMMEDAKEAAKTATPRPNPWKTTTPMTTQKPENEAGEGEAEGRTLDHRSGLTLKRYKSPNRAKALLLKKRRRG